MINYENIKRIFRRLFRNKLTFIGFILILVNMIMVLFASNDLSL